MPALESFLICYTSSNVFDFLPTEAYLLIVMDSTADYKLILVYLAAAPDYSAIPRGVIWVLRLLGRT